MILLRTVCRKPLTPMSYHHSHHVRLGSPPPPTLSPSCAALLRRQPVRTGESRLSSPLVSPPSTRVASASSALNRQSPMRVYHHRRPPHDATVILGCAAPAFVGGNIRRPSACSARPTAPGAIGWPPTVTSDAAPPPRRRGVPAHGYPAPPPPARRSAGVQPRRVSARRRGCVLVDGPSNPQNSDPVGRPRIRGGVGQTVEPQPTAASRVSAACVAG